MNNEKLDYVIKGLSKLTFVKAVILFGSQVTGNARPDSDTDIAVLTKEIDNDKETQILGFSSEKFDISIFNKLPLIIQFRVIRDGKLVFCNDKKYFHNISYEVIRKYLDFSVFINNFYKKIIKNVWLTNGRQNNKNLIHLKSFL